MTNQTMTKVTPLGNRRFGKTAHCEKQGRAAAPLFPLGIDTPKPSRFFSLGRKRCLGIQPISFLMFLGDTARGERILEFV